MRYRELNGYSVLRLVHDDKGALDGAISENLLGVEIEQGTGFPLVLHTIRGREPAGSAIVGPDGEVTFNHRLWPGVESFLNWAKEHLQ